MDKIAIAAPPLPQKTKLRPKSPPSDFPSPTVPVDSVTPSVSLDVFHNSNSFSEEQNRNVVKILICPQNEKNINKTNVNLSENFVIKNKSTESNNVSPCIRISVNSDMDQNSIMAETPHETSNSYFDYGLHNYRTMSSGQISPSDTLDSGTCSDLDGTPPPLPIKKIGGVSITLIENDSDGNESSISCDSLNNDKVLPVNNPIIISSLNKSPFLPQTLLQDIRQRNTKLTPTKSFPIIDEKSYEERKKRRNRGEERNRI
ncbi:hypothetical protein NQ314_020402 [Rhamnusium bicolor]|uniref:Exophilin 5 n=1 Tax=Rhamnusium bicolor TaxID=1586634 RepID=A0AAV8WK55_9CUCU|nr:hypothetical protein NQ314_020402 [Rhamnusium bicolor]